jgi:hypothetical protein
MSSWPSELPQRPRFGYSRTQQNNVIENRPDFGPTLRRRRFTAISKYYDVSMVIDEAGLTIFDSFFNSTIKSGALSFAWRNPDNDVAADCRIVPDTVEHTQVSPGGTEERRLYMVTFVLEVLPS